MLIQTRDQFLALRAALMQAPMIAVDTETNGLKQHMGHRLCGISVACNHPTDERYRLSAYFPFRHEPPEMNLFTISENLPEEWIRDLKGPLEREDVTLIYHNFKFDAKMLRAENIIPRGYVYDVMVMSHMIQENGVHSLKGLAAEKWGQQVRVEESFVKQLAAKRKKRGDKNSSGYERLSASEMAPYACKDADLTLDLYREFVNELEEQGLTKLWESQEREFLYCLLEMEWQGVQIDVAMAEQRAEQCRLRMRELEDEIGFDPGKRSVLARKLFAAPPDGLGYPPGELNLPTSEFPHGEPKMDQEILSKMNHPLPKKVLEYRHLVKANSTWWTGYREKMDADQRIHPEYSTAIGKEKFGTVTGRLSCSWPNLQQMPRSDETPVKRLLLPPKDHSMIEFDYSQIELRLATAYSKDKLYTDAFLSGDDAHQSTANAIGVSRQTGKHVAFTVLYGGGADTLKATIERLEFQTTGKVIDFPEIEARAIIDRYYTVHPNLKSIAKQCEWTARKRGYIKLWTGRRRHFLETEPWTHRKAFNSLIQGGAAEIVKHSMLMFYRLKNPQYRMVTQIHDALWFEVPDHNAELWTEDIQRIMEWPTRKFPIPFPVESKLIRRHNEEDKWKKDTMLLTLE